MEIVEKLMDVIYGLNWEGVKCACAHRIVQPFCFFFGFGLFFDTNKLIVNLE